MCRIDEGALRGLKRKESGGRLLPAGVLRIEGLFASHQAVKLVVRRRRRAGIPSTLVESPSVDQFDPSLPSSPTTASTFITTTNEPTTCRPIPHLTTTGSTSDPSSPDLTTEPVTPTIQPALSLSSSIASLDPLSKTVPASPAIQAISERLTATNIDGQGQGVRVVHELAIARGEKVGLMMGEEGDWEEIEVGKGLAQYNSVEIDRIKGLKRWVE